MRLSNYDWWGLICYAVFCASENSQHSCDLWGSIVTTRGQPEPFMTPHCRTFHSLSFSERLIYLSSAQWLVSHMLSLPGPLLLGQCDMLCPISQKCICVLQWRAVRFVAGEALTFSESNLQIHKPNLVTAPMNARNLLTASRRYMLLNIDFYINQDNGF